MKRLIFSLVGMILITVLGYAGSPVMDGVLDADAGYNQWVYLASTDREGFGSGYDVSGIWSTNDSNSVYFFIQCRTQLGTDTGILFLINSSYTTGIAKGNSLGGVTGGIGVFATDSQKWKMDFPVVLAFYLTSSTAGYYTVSEATYYDGIKEGIWATDNYGKLIPLGYSIHAFNNNKNTSGPGGSTGWEIAIKRFALNAVDQGDKLQAFAIVVNDDGYFSDDAAPDPFAGNAGFNPDFNSGGYTATAEHTNMVPLENNVPVELSGFKIH